MVILKTGMTGERPGVPAAGREKKMSGIFTETQIKEKLIDFLRGNYILTDDILLGDDDSFMENGILDSTGILELIGFLEETFRISVADEEMIPENLDSLGNIVRYLKAKMDRSKSNSHVGV